MKAEQTVECDVRLELTESGSALSDEAFVLMERALELLDRAGLHDAARHLDHAVCLVPDLDGNMPRVRLTQPLSL